MCQSIHQHCVCVFFFLAAFSFLVLHCTHSQVHIHFIHTAPNNLIVSELQLRVNVSHSVATYGRLFS